MPRIPYFYYVSNNLSENVAFCIWSIQVRLHGKEYFLFQVGEDRVLES